MSERHCAMSRSLKYVLLLCLGLWLAGCQPVLHVYLVNHTASELVVSLKGLDARYREFFPKVPLDAHDQFVLAAADSIEFMYLSPPNGNHSAAEYILFDTLVLQGSAGERILAGKDAIHAQVRHSRGYRERITY